MREYPRCSPRCVVLAEERPSARFLAPFLFHFSATPMGRQSIKGYANIANYFASPTPTPPFEVQRRLRRACGIGIRTCAIPD